MFGRSERIKQYYSRKEKAHEDAKRNAEKGVVETQGVVDGEVVDGGQENIPVESDAASHEDVAGGAAEEYARASFDLQDALKQKVKKYEEVQEKFDTLLLESKGAVLESIGDARKLLESVEMTSKETGADFGVYNFTDEESSTVLKYLQSRRAYDASVADRLAEVREGMEGGNSESDVEVALDALLAFENDLMNEEIRLQKNVGGGPNIFEKVRDVWKRLGDVNIAALLQDKKGWQPKSTLWGKVGYGALRAASLRTGLMALLMPAAGLGFGAAGVAAALSVKRGIGVFSGGSAGHAFAKGWLEKDLKKKVDELSALEDADEEDYERVIEMKKEYDAFIRRYHSDTADEMRDGAEYQKIHNIYREAVTFFCKDAMKAEELRMKQNLGEVRARNIIKKHKYALFGGAALGGAVSALVAPKVIDAVSDLVDGSDAAYDASSSKPYKAPETPPRAAPSLRVPGVLTDPSVDADSQNIRMSPGRSFAVTSVDEEMPVPRSTTDSGGSQDAVPESVDTTVAAEEFLVDAQGVYTVQDGNRLSTIWLDKSDGDAEQVEQVMRALRMLQSTEEGVATLKHAFGISSGDVEKIYPGDKIQTGAIQEWFDAREQQPVVAEHPQSITSSRVFEVPEGAEETLHIVAEGEGTVADVLKPYALDAGGIPQNILERPVFDGHEVRLFTTEEGKVAGIVVDGEYFSPEHESPTDAHDVSEQAGGAEEQNLSPTSEHTTNRRSSTLSTGRPPSSESLGGDFDMHEVVYRSAGTSGGDRLDDVISGTLDGSEVSGGSVVVEGSYRDIVKTAAGMKGDLHDPIVFARADGAPILTAAELRQIRPDLFAGDREIASTIVRRDDSVLVQLDNPPQKKFLIETNQKGALNHDYVQKEFDSIEESIKKPASTHSARQEVIKKSIQALTIEKSPADTALFDALTDRLSEKIVGDANLTDRMLSEKGWGDRRIRIAYSEDQGHLEVQERLNVNSGKRYRKPKWVWKSILAEKVSGKK